MKNFLIVLAVLVVCFGVAVCLVLYPTMTGGHSVRAGSSYMIATWQDFNDPDLTNLDITVGTDQMFIDVPQLGQSRRITVPGHWRLHSFYCDSHLDAPAEIVVARELKNEDLEVDIGRYLPNHPGKIVCVKTFRIIDEDERPPYPENTPGQKISYPPPKGLIRPGMLECDLQSLPWGAESIVSTPMVMTANFNSLSDGKSNQDYFTRDSDNNDDVQSMVYTYRSDRADAPKLLVTVYQGRVVEVVGGAEETNDIPYRLPERSPPAVEKSEDKDAS